jgi:hypothetical protein
MLNLITVHDPEPEIDAEEWISRKLAEKILSQIDTPVCITKDNVDKVNDSLLETAVEVMARLAVGSSVVLVTSAIARKLGQSPMIGGMSFERTVFGSVYTYTRTA